MEAVSADPAAFMADSAEFAKVVGRELGEGDMGPRHRKNREFMFWKMCARPNCRVHTNKDTGENPRLGWITVAETGGTPLEFERLRSIKHMTPLMEENGTPKYGAPLDSQERYDYPKAMGKIVANGGIHEFPASQIIAYGWDENGTLKRIRPDVVSPQRVTCQYGCRRRFLNIDDYHDHIAVMHKEAVGQDLLAARLGEAVREVKQAPPPVITPEMIKEIVTAAVVESSKAMLSTLGPVLQPPVPDENEPDVSTGRAKTKPSDS